MLIFILVVCFLAVGMAALNSYRERVNDEQEFRMYQDPEYRKFIEEKRRNVKLENKKSVLILGVIVIAAVSVFALMKKGGNPDTKQVVLTTITKENDLVVNFRFDKERVNIIFISPSGERLAIGDEGVAFVDGDRWRRYRISDAEVGEWRVEYNLGENEFIDYSIINEGGKKTLEDLGG